MPRKKKSTAGIINLKALMKEDEEFLRTLVQQALQEILEGEMNEALGAGKYERAAERLGYRSGYYVRTLISRVGPLELRVPQDRNGRFSTELFERYSRSEKSLVLALMEMYVQGISTRKIKQVTEELCGHEFSASTVSRLNKGLDEGLKKFSERRLSDKYSYLILDAQYQRVRENGVVRRRAVLIAMGVNQEGRRCILGIEMANRESLSSWKDFIRGLKERGLQGTKFVVSDSHEGLRQAISEILPEAVWQRCYVHFLRNALDYLPRKAKLDDCLTELRWLYERRNIEEARKDLNAWLSKWQTKYRKLCDWVEENIEETLTFYRLPWVHRKHLRSSNVLERLNEEIRRRTRVLRIFPNEESCLRLVRALGAEIHEKWQEGNCYLNMEVLKEDKKELLNKGKEAA